MSKHTHFPFYEKTKEGWKWMKKRLELKNIYPRQYYKVIYAKT